MGYTFDAFLSYSRKGSWPDFVDNLFMPMLEHWLGAELGRAPRIFYDARYIETGQSWPEQLAEALATSRIMVALWSREYFASDWCKAELGQMLARAEQIRADGGKPRIILATVIHDGEDIPTALKNIQYVEMQQYANPWLNPKSEKAGELAEIIRGFAVEARRAISEAPDYDPEWRRLATESFIRTFSTGRADQLSVPTLRWGDV